MKLINFFLKNILHILNHVKFIFMPNYWLMNNDYDREWDKKLNSLMEEFDFETYSKEINLGGTNLKLRESLYEAKLGETVIWIENHPYASFIERESDNLFGFSNFKKQGRPSKLTIYRAHKKWKKDIKMSKMTKQELRSYKLDQIL